MAFQRIPQIYVEGATLFDMSLDSLHSDTVDLNSLSEWLYTFADLDSYEDVDYETGKTESFYKMFLKDVLAFCVHIASSDGGITTEEVDGIKMLFGEKTNLSQNLIDQASRWISNTKFASYYPITFTILVADLGHLDGDVTTAAQVAFFFRQVARYVYSIDNDSNFDDDCPARDYVDSFFKYVERVSATHFILPDDEYKIEEICSSWNRLVNLTSDKLRMNLPGSWKATSGDALFKGGLSNIVLQPDGRGYMLKKALFTTRKLDLTWSIRDTEDTALPVIHIPSIDAYLFMTVLDSNRMVASVFSPNERLNRTTAMYLRLKYDL